MKEVHAPDMAGKSDVSARPETPRPWRTLGAFEALTKAQQEALGWIYIGRDGGQNARTVAALLKAGWIVAYEDSIPGSGKSPIDRLPMTVTRYTFPSIAAHMAWCEWCGDLPDDDHDASPMTVGEGGAL